MNRNARRLLLAAFAALVVVGIIKGSWEAYHTDYDALYSTPQPLKTPEVYHTELPGNEGFTEWFKSKGIRSDKALPAGYATCSDLALFGLDFTYSELLKAGTVQQSDDLLYASVHYLCTDWETPYQDWMMKRASPSGR